MQSSGSSSPADHNEVAIFPHAELYVTASDTKQGLNYVSALSPPHTPGGLVIATSNWSSVHQTFLIKFQVNRLRSDVPEAEWQSGSQDNTELFVCEPQQQEEGIGILPLSLL